SPTGETGEKTEGEKTAGERTEGEKAAAREEEEARGRAGGDGKGTIEMLLLRRAGGGRAGGAAEALDDKERFDTARRPRSQEPRGGRLGEPGAGGGAVEVGQDRQYLGQDRLGELVGGSAREEATALTRVQLFRFLRRRFQTAANLFHLILSTQRLPTHPGEEDHPVAHSPGGPGSSTISNSGSDAWQLLLPGAAGTTPLTPPMGGPGGNVVHWEALVAGLEGVEGCPVKGRELREVARGLADPIGGMIAFRDIQAAMRETPSEAESRRAAARAVSAVANAFNGPNGSHGASPPPGGGGDRGRDAPASSHHPHHHPGTREVSPVPRTAPGGGAGGGAGGALGQLRGVLKGVWGTAWEAFVFLDLRKADKVRRSDIRQGVKRLLARGVAVRRSDIRQGVKRLLARGVAGSQMLDADAAYDALDPRATGHVTALQFVRYLAPGWHVVAGETTLAEYERHKTKRRA
ncbi:hypothetical protein T484DRAFT_1829556, partial [Baffinella frigidus]